MADERRHANWEDDDPSEQGNSSGFADTLRIIAAANAERLARGARYPDFSAAAAAASANLYNNNRLLLATGAGAPSVAGFDTASMGSGSYNALQGLHPQPVSFVDPSLSLWGNFPSRFSSQSLPPHLQGPLGSGAGLPRNLTMPTDHALNMSQAAFLNRGAYTDSASLLHQELAANVRSSLASFVDPFSSAPSQTAAAAYLDFVSRQQALNSMAAAQQYQVSREQQDALAGTIFEAHRIASLSRQNMPYGGGVTPNEAPLTHHHQQDPFARAPAAKTSSLLHSSAIPSYDPLLPSPGFQVPLDRTEATRFLAGGGTRNQLAFSGNLLTRNYALDSSGHSLPEGKEEPETKASHTSSRASLKDDDPYQLDLPWEELVADSALTLPELRGVVSDVHFAVMVQMKPCVLTHEDRVGLYKTREIGFPGMCCKHCGGVPGFGRYFPGSLTSLVNGNICKSIIKHLREECRVCPSKVRESILKLERQDDLKPFHYRRGSRRQFFTHVWNKVQEGQNLEADTSLIDADSSRSGESVALGEDVAVPTARFDDSDEIIPWAKILEGSDVVLMSDRHLVPDTIFAATAQTKPCQVTEGDRVGRCKDHKLGSMGLCCKHCGGKAGAFGRYFPSNLHTFAQVEVCKQIVKHITRKCHACPPQIRNAIVDLQQLEKTKPSKRHPSRMVFFRRVWHRFHYSDNPDGAAAAGDSGSEDAKPSAGADTIAAEDIPWEMLLKDSKIVTLDDHGLISDSQFAAIAQMDRCELLEADRIGYNKHREIGFVGLCCRYCGGRPGFGRYFPNTVRNFEKTSARDTIVSHISLFCQECPEDVRKALLSLKRIESSRDGSATMKGLIYGSGKLFFRRVWSRLHSDGDIDDNKDSKAAGIGSRRSAKRKRPSIAKADLPHRSRASKDDSDSSGDETDSSEDAESESSTAQGKRKNPSSSPHDKVKRQKKSA